MLSSEDVRENPGTLALAASWVLVFVLILVVQRQSASPAAGPSWEPLPVSTATSHRFGDMTWLEVRQGQAWRAVTATFIHFGLIHVTLNTLGLINLGRLVEPWYRTGPFLAICLAIGGLGNLTGGALRQLSSTARPWLASVASARHWPGAIERFLQGGAAAPVSIHTGGGSTILLGLLALGAVVGWRSKTRIGSHLQKQMVILLALTAVLGVGMSNLVDNYGHLGGAIVGGIIGLFDRPLIRLSESKAFRATCWAIVGAVMVACLGSAGRDDRAEVDYLRRFEEVASRGRVAEGTKAALDRLYALYAGEALRSDHLRDPANELDALAVADLLGRGPVAPTPADVAPEQAARDREELARVLDHLDEIPGDRWGGRVEGDLARLRQLGRRSLDASPSYEQVYDFFVCWSSASRAVSDDLARLKARVFDLDQEHKRGR